VMTQGRDRDPRLNFIIPGIMKVKRNVRDADCYTETADCYNETPGTYLPNYARGKRVAFASLGDAMAACTKLGRFSGGITKHRGKYELRAAWSTKPSPTNEVSWCKTKTEHDFRHINYAEEQRRKKRTARMSTGGRQPKCGCSLVDFPHSGFTWHD